MIDRIVCAVFIALVACSMACSDDELLTEPPIDEPGALPETVYVWTMGTSAQNIMMASLAGIVNRNTAGELLISPIYNSLLPHPVFWVNELKAAHPEVRVRFDGNPTFFITRYRAMLRGYVLYDRALNSHSINIATSIAGITDAIVVNPATLQFATAADLPLIADARTMTYSQAWAQYGSQFNKDMLFHQETDKDDVLRDYAIMHKGFVFHTDPTALDPPIGDQNSNGRIYGWGPVEFDLFLQASQHSQVVVASGWSWSSSTTSKWRVPLAKQKYHAAATLVAKSGRHYVAFVMSDGDNVSSLTGQFATDPKWFGSRHRGNFDMTWDLTSTLAEMNPVAFNYYYEHASNGDHKDSFVSPGGAGSSFPSEYPDIPGLVASVSESMKLADQKVVSILDSSYEPSTLYPILDDPQVMGMMFKTYANAYAGRDGAIDWHNGKPIVSVKYSLWDGVHTARGIADALNADTHRDAAGDQASFSIVNVHPWSTLGPTGTGTGDPMSNLNQLVQWLDPTRVEVVTLEELIVHLRKGFGAPL